MRSLHLEELEEDKAFGWSEQRIGLLISVAVGYVFLIHIATALTRQCCNDLDTLPGTLWTQSSTSQTLDLFCTVICSFLTRFKSHCRVTRSRLSRDIRWLICTRSLPFLHRTRLNAIGRNHFLPTTLLDAYSGKRASSLLLSRCRSHSWCRSTFFLNIHWYRLQVS